LRLINWVANNFTHRGSGSDKLPATAPVLPLFGGRLCFSVRFWFYQYKEANNSKKSRKKPERPTEKLE
jgi:hypothetical protein